MDIYKYIRKEKNMSGRPTYINPAYKLFLVDMPGNNWSTYEEAIQKGANCSIILNLLLSNYGKIHKNTKEML